MNKKLLKRIESLEKEVRDLKEQKIEPVSEVATNKEMMLAIKKSLHKNIMRLLGGKAAVPELANLPALLEEFIKISEIYIES